MELLLKHIKENVEKQKGICIVFRVKEGSSSCYSRPGENQGLNSRRYDDGFNPSSGVGIQVGIITIGMRKQDSIKIGPNKVTTNERRRNMKRSKLAQVRDQNEEGLQVLVSRILYHTSLIKLKVQMTC